MLRRIFTYFLCFCLVFQSFPLYALEKEVTVLHAQNAYLGYLGHMSQTPVTCLNVQKGKQGNIRLAFDTSLHKQNTDILLILNNQTVGRVFFGQQQLNFWGYEGNTFSLESAPGYTYPLFCAQSQGDLFLNGGKFSKDSIFVAQNLTTNGNFSGEGALAFQAQKNLSVLGNYALSNANVRMQAKQKLNLNATGTVSKMHVEAPLIDEAPTTKFFAQEQIVVTGYSQGYTHKGILKSKKHIVFNNGGTYIGFDKSQTIAGCLFENTSQSISEAGRLVAGLGFFQATTLSFKDTLDFIGYYFLANSGADLTTDPKSLISVQYGAHLKAKEKHTHKGTVSQVGVSTLQFPYMEMFGLEGIKPGSLNLQEMIRKVGEIKNLQDTILPSVDLKGVVLEGNQSLTITGNVSTPNASVNLIGTKLNFKGAVQSGFFNELNTVIKSRSACVAGVISADKLILSIDQNLKLNGSIKANLTQVIFTQEEIRLAEQKKTEELAKQKLAEEQRKKGEEEKKKKAEELAKQKLTEEQRKKEEENKRKAEEARKLAEQKKPTVVESQRKLPDQNKLAPAPTLSPKKLEFGPNLQMNSSFYSQGADVANLDAGTMNGNDFFLDAKNIIQKPENTICVEQDVSMRGMIARLNGTNQGNNINVEVSKKLEVLPEAKIIAIPKPLNDVQKIEEGQKVKEVKELKQPIKTQEATPSQTQGGVVSLKSRDTEIGGKVTGQSIYGEGTQKITISKTAEITTTPASHPSSLVLMGQEGHIKEGTKINNSTGETLAKIGELTIDAPLNGYNTQVQSTNLKIGESGEVNAEERSLIYADESAKIAGKQKGTHTLIHTKELNLKEGSKVQGEESSTINAINATLNEAVESTNTHIFVQNTLTTAKTSTTKGTEKTFIQAKYLDHGGIFSGGEFFGVVTEKTKIDGSIENEKFNLKSPVFMVSPTGEIYVKDAAVDARKAYKVDGNFESENNIYLRLGKQYDLANTVAHNWLMLEADYYPDIIGTLTGKYCDLTNTNGIHTTTKDHVSLNEQINVPWGIGLTARGIEVLKSIVAENLYLTATKEDIRLHQTLLNAHDNLKLTALEGSVKASGTALLAEQGDLGIQAALDILWESLKHRTGNGQNYREEKIATEAKAGGTLGISAGRDIRFKAVETQSGKNTSLEAGQNIIDIPLALESQTVSHHKKNYTRDKNVRQDVSRHHAGGEFASTAGSSQELYAPEVTAKKIKLTGGHEVNVHEVHDIHEHESKTRKKGGFLGKSKTTQHSSGAANSKGAKLTSTDPVEITSGHDINLTTVTIQAPKTVLTAVDGIVQILLGTNHYSASTMKSSSNVAWQKQSSKIEEHHTFTPSTFTGTVEIHSKESIIQSIQGQTLDFLKQVNQQGGKITLTGLEEFHHVDKKTVQGPTKALAAVVALAVSICTAGTGTALGGMVAGGLSATGTAASVVSGMTAAGFSSLCSQAGLALLASEGNIAKAAKHLARSDTLKSLGVSIVAAGLTAGLGDKLGIEMSASKLAGITKADIGAGIEAHLKANLLKSVVSGGVELAFGGANPEAMLLQAAQGIAAGVIGGVGANKIGEAYGAVDIDAVTHKLLHTLLGGATGAIMSNKPGEGALAGAMGAFIAETFAECAVDHKKLQREVVLEALNEGRIHTDESYRQAYREKLNPYIDSARLTSGMVALLLGHDPSKAIYTATNALENNCLPLILGALGSAAVATAEVEAMIAAGTLLVVAGIILTKDLVDKKKEQDAATSSSSGATPPDDWEPEDHGRNKKSDEKNTSEATTENYKTSNFEKGDNIGLHRFNQRLRGGNMKDPKTGQIITPDKATHSGSPHGGSRWKLFENIKQLEKNKRIGTISEDGHWLRD